MDSQNISKQIAFIKEIDKMKLILRRNKVIGESKHEDDAEHSWHAATMAMLLAEHAKPTVNIDRAVKMLLIHDLVEIYAGDTPCYEMEQVKTQAAREQTAADKLFTQLPEEQGKELRALWEEFDAVKTDDARYAAAIDHVQPMLLNYYTNGSTWRGYHVKRSQVLKRNDLTRTEIPALWDFVVNGLQEYVEKGILEDE